MKRNRRWKEKKKRVEAWRDNVEKDGEGIRKHYQWRQNEETTKKKEEEERKKK